MINPEIFVALDFSTELDAKKFINNLNPSLCGVKIGKELFTSSGPKIVNYAIEKDFKVFLDLKYHDIPNTVKKACLAASNLGVYMLNIHSLGGDEMILAAREGVDQSKYNPLLIGVTLLTSHNQKTIDSIGFNNKLNDQIKKLALNASKYKLDGIVCSVNDLKFLKPLLPKNFHFITPGIRLNDENKDDQKRIATPSEAKKLGSTMLVIGRPITSSKNPLEEIERIKSQLDSI